MNTQTVKLNDLAQYFTTGKRDNDEIYYFLNDEAPQVLHDAIHEAHGDMLPDDFIYSLCYDICCAFEEHEEVTSETAYDVMESLEPSIYTADLTKWLASNNMRIDYLNEAIEIYNITDGFQLLATAQMCEINERGNLFINYLQNN